MTTLAAESLLTPLDAVCRELEATRQELATTRQERDVARQEAITDPLTGIGNRRVIEDLLGPAADTGTALLVGLVDVDDFKAVNDTHGHPVGDELLRTVATILSTVAADIAAPLPGPAGQAARYGGDEIALFLPAAADPDLVARRVSTALADHAALHRDQPRATLSMGWASTGEVPLAGVLKAADAALLIAKRSARDGCIVRSARHPPRPRQGPLPRPAAAEIPALRPASKATR